MKTNTTYPTKQQHSIDDLEYFGVIKKRKRIGISFVTAFVIVLAMHLIGVGGIFAFSNLKAQKKPSSIAEAPLEKESGPQSDALARNEWPQPEAQPQVLATPHPVKKEVVAAKAPLKAEPKSAPVVAAKPNEKPLPPAMAKTAPKAAPAAPKVDDSAAKKAFLASRSASQALAETQQTIPAASRIQSVAAPNPEGKVETARAQAPANIAPSKPEVVVSAPVQRHQPTPSSRPSEYTLAPGDNLYMVSRRLQVSYNDLMKANGLSDPRQLRVGQKLRVPDIHIASL